MIRSSCFAAAALAVVHVCPVSAQSDPLAKNESRATGTTVPTLASRRATGRTLIGAAAPETTRRRVSLSKAQAISGPELPGTIAWGGERDIPPVVAPPKGPPAAGQPDLALGALQRGYVLSAVAFALPRAEAGDPAAQVLLAELYAVGRGVSRDLDAARSWYRFAADGGDAQAQFAYASMLLADTAKGASRSADVRDFMRKAADQGHAQAQFNLAQMIVNDRPSYAGFEEALPFYRSAAEAGLPDAQYALATLLADGSGMPLADVAAARTWLERAAENGFDTAQVELGIWLVNGKGGPADIAKGRAWLERAGRDGNAIARNRLAKIHALGVGTAVDPIKAGAWHILTKRAGFVDAEMDRRFSSYDEATQRNALKLANSWR